MKWFLNLMFVIMVITGAFALISGAQHPTANVHPYTPTKTEESTCHMPMCESFGGHDAIALQFAFGD